MITVTITGLILAAVNGYLVYKIVEQKKEIQRLKTPPTGMAEGPEYFTYLQGFWNNQMYPDNKLK